MHEIHSDLEAYTKEDMSNNKFIFQEQQKIAIKLCKALEMTLDEFKDLNKRLNQNYNPVVESPNFMSKLPCPDEIYYKDFHFLDMPLIKMKPISE